MSLLPGATWVITLLQGAGHSFSISPLPRVSTRAAPTAKSGLQEPGGLGRLQDQEYGGAHTRSALPAPILQQRLEAARERERDRRQPAEVDMATSSRPPQPSSWDQPTSLVLGSWISVGQDT